MLNNHKKFMKIALKLALNGKGRVEPNPMVGAVVVKNGKIIAKGYHEYYGGPHAEVNALNRAGKLAKGADLYVTLEPCSTWGKTPPCTEKIIKSGIKNVFCASADANPLNRFKGIKNLARNNIKVTNEVLKEKALKMNKIYFDKFMSNTYVIVKYAMSLDGKIATKKGDSKWITNERSRKEAHRLRSKVDAVVVGIGTVLNDNPELSSHGLGKDPIKVVIDPSLKIPLNSRILEKPGNVIIFSRASSNKIRNLAKKASLVHVLSKNGRIPFTKIIEKLSEISIKSVLIEGGGDTIASAIDSGVVNEVYAFIAPKIIGGKEAKTPVEGKGIGSMKNALNLRDIKIQKIGTDILVKGKIK